MGLGIYSLKREGYIAWTRGSSKSIFYVATDRYIRFCGVLIISDQLNTLGRLINLRHVNGANIFQAEK